MTTPKPSEFSLETCDKLQGLVKELKKKQPELYFHQQDKTYKHMAIMGGNGGTLWIQPVTSKNSYDIAPYGEPLESKMRLFIEGSLNKEYPGALKFEGYKHPNKNPKREPREPYWRTSDWRLVEAAARHYAGL